MDRNKNFESDTIGLKVNVNVNVTDLRTKSCNRVTMAAPWESSSVVSGIVQVARMMISGTRVERSSTEVQKPQKHRNQM